jgi:PAS domain S-box-containing protein
MKKGNNPSADDAELRLRAEARLRATATTSVPARTAAETQRLVHELQVDRIELEIQNEELRQSRAEVEAGLERYTDLYDFAPVGYFTLGCEGAIRQVNLTGAHLLGVERARLPGRLLGLFVREPDRVVFNAFLEKAVAGREKEVCEVALLEKEKGPLAVQITAEVSRDGQECRVMMADITERRQALEQLRRAHAEVERRVVERTAELSNLNKELELEIASRKNAEKALRGALSEIQALKDQLEAKNVYFRQEAMLKQHFGNIIGQSNALKYVLYRAEQVAPTNATVLVLGETGTGKGLIAALIHQMSPCRDRALVTVNCAALPANLIESELFGHEKGAFTGADRRLVGRFEIADCSTICLDEIAELPLEVQAKLLRVIQHNEFERLGSSRTVKVNVRIVATTNRDLEAEVRAGRFRQDLFYRINVFPLTVPPLRQRKEDISLLVEHVTTRFARKLGKQFTSIHKDTIKALQEYPWPGNIRELESVIERAVVLCPGPVLQLADKLEAPAACGSSGLKTLEETEREQILKALSETRWRINGKRGAAEILGLHPSTLRARMHKLGIGRPETKA